MSVDFAHTRTATENRRAKAVALADAAASAGLVPVELAVVGREATWAAAAARRAVRVSLGLSRDASVETWQAALGHLEEMAACLPSAVTCGLCGWTVLRVRLESGADLLVDPWPHPAGTVWRRPDAPATVLAGHAPQRPEDPDQLYRQHTRSCTGAKGHAARRIAAAPRCTVCHGHLDPVLPVHDRTYTTHPTCDPREGR